MTGSDEDPLFWLALADTQWTWGRLEAHVRKRALRALADGADLALWEGKPEHAARVLVFQKLATRLALPVPPPKPVRERAISVAWRRGQLWAYSTLDGRKVVFRITAVDPAYGFVPSPLVELLDIVFDDEPPSAAALRRAGLRPVRASYIGQSLFDAFPAEHRGSPMFMPKVNNRGDLPRHRLKRLRAHGEPRPADPATTQVIGLAWEAALDEFLPDAFEVGGPRLGVERMEWPDTLPSTMWQLGLLACRGAGVGARQIKAASVVRQLVVMGFPAVGALREVGYRKPKDVDHVYGLIFKTWDELPDEIEHPDRSLP